MTIGKSKTVPEDSDKSEPEEVQLEEKNDDLESSAPGCCNGYPWWVCFIIGNEFCERYAYYGMRAVLVLYLNQFIGFSKDVSTEIYHAYVALCYFTPLIGAIVADSFWGKFKTIFILSIVYVIGMFIMAISALNFTGDPDVTEGDTTNMALCITALVVVACGTGGIKPCVSTLGGDQFGQDERGLNQLKDFFSIFYFAINAGSLLSTFITPVLRANGSYFLAFIVPAGLMLIALLVFLAGSSHYTKNMPTGNIFSQFCGATFSGIGGKIRSKKGDKREHFMDYADASKYPKQVINDAKWVFPILVMYIPIPMFWALFDMQGSRWTQTATQMNGYLGSVQILPDQIQLLNALMILLFLPIFQKLIYPAFEYCGIRVTPLRKMSLGQLITALSFVISGFVQIGIQKGLTAVPDYGKENTLMITNALNRPITVSSPYWLSSELPEDVDSTIWCTENECTFTIEDGYPRTPTFDWLNEYNKNGNYKLSIDGNDQFIINPKNALYSSGEGACPSKEDCDNCQQCDENVVKTQLHTITNVVYYTDANGAEKTFQYLAPKDKSQSLSVKLSFLNPTERYMQVKLSTEKNPDPFSMVSGKTKESYSSPFCAMTNGNAEFDPNVSGDSKNDYRLVIQLYDPKDIEAGLENIDKDHADYEKIILDNFEASEPAVHCTTDVIDPDQIKSGSIWTAMPIMTGLHACKATAVQDSNPNTVSVLMLIPQYVVITISEVLNSVTGLEFAYSQAPKSMKSTVQSFWLLTTCIGNIIVIFLVSVKIGGTQAGEYFILAIIMFAMALIFVFLSIFYYEYVDPDEFEEDEEEDEKVSNNPQSSIASGAAKRDTVNSNASSTAL